MFNINKELKQNEFGEVQGGGQVSQQTSQEENMIDLSSDALEERIPNFIPSIDGVNDVYLENIKVGEYNGTTTIDFLFKQIINNKIKAEQTIRIFDNTINSLQSDPEAHKKQMRDNFSRIKHFFTGYISEEAVTSSKYPNFKAMCEGLIQKLGDSFKGKKGRLYVTYNNKGYVQIPLYPINYLSTEFRPTSFEHDPQYHKMTKPMSDSSAIGSAPSGGGSSAQGAF